MRRTLVFCLFVGILVQAPGVETQGQATQTESSASTPLPLDHGGKIESRYDGFNHETVVMLRKMNVTCSDVVGPRRKFKNLCVSVAVSLHCPGKQVDYVREAKIQISFETNDWDARHPLGERKLSVVADGTTLQLGSMHLASNGVGTGWLDEKMREVFEISVPYKTFEQIVRAEYVEMSMGKTAFELREKNVAALRDLNNRVRIAGR